MTGDELRERLRDAMRASSATRPHNSGVTRETLSVTGAAIRHRPRGSYIADPQYAGRAPMSSFERAALADALSDAKVLDTLARLVSDDT
ncbi:hypothetical protein AB3X94_08055 [Paraburkholderia sp. BR10923]|uniref:hypothetical protein n=1 Tax=Paraburkholderia sp. BR10923 TaxID=3236992 RepID=UPI0034CE08FE